MDILLDYVSQDMTIHISKVWKECGVEKIDLIFICLHLLISAKWQY